MCDLENTVEIIIEDFAELEKEIQKELKLDEEERRESWTDIMGLMREHQYSDQISAIRDRIRNLMDELEKQLRHLPKITPRETGDSENAVQFKSSVEEIQGLLSRMMAVWDRLEKLVSFIEQKQIALQGKVMQGITALKGWAATIKSWIIGISTQLWNLLCKLLTPKEWKISGEIGSGPFGLGKVGVEIVFGS